jgi:hypothetical protein
MNLIILKYGILIGALLTTTAFVSGTFNNTSAVQGEQNSSGIDTQSVFAFGSQVFYKDVSQPGNEYMQGSVQGYSQDLVPNDTENQAYASSWQAGVAEFETGYNRCNSALFDLASVPVLQTNQQKMAVCQEFLDGENEMIGARNDFLSAKSSTSPAVDSGFTIAMVLERVDEIIQSSDDADQSCMKAVLADHNHDPAEFSANLKDTQSAVQEMKRVYPELKVLSTDFT